MLNPTANVNFLQNNDCNIIYKPFTSEKNFRLNCYDALYEGKKFRDDTTLSQELKLILYKNVFEHKFCPYLPQSR